VSHRACALAEPSQESEIDMHHRMLKIMILSFLLIAGVVSAATLSRGPDARVAGHPTAAAVERAAPVAVDVAAGALRLDTAADPCDGASASSDAASCATGGWLQEPQLGCCHMGTPQVQARWRHGSQIKCCGNCALLE
jgi:hypothetical protein